MWAFFSSKSGEEDGDETENNDLAMLEGGQADTPASLKAFPAYKPPASLKTGRVRGIGGGIPSLPAAAPPPAPRGVLSSAEIELREKLRDTEAASAHHRPRHQIFQPQASLTQPIGASLLTRLLCRTT